MASTVAGDVWAGQDGVGYRGERGYASVSPAGAQAHAADRPQTWFDDTSQASAGPEGACAAVPGYVVNGRPEFSPDAPAPVIELPWLRRDGWFFRAEDGRTTILRGVDYPYPNEGGQTSGHHLRDEDYDRIAAWGMNLLRIRMRDYRAGMYPSRPPEPGYLENLDHIIANANARGLYVIIATGGPPTAMPPQERPLDPAFDQLKFIEGTPEQEHWLDYLESLFVRYRDHPGVVGFDTINEDDSYPPIVHDRVFMRGAHLKVLERLRRHSDRHVYFQQPSGWGYWKLPTVGWDLEDDNRHFCYKWKPQNPDYTVSNMQTMLERAQEANAPLFICEWYMTQDGSGQEGAAEFQRHVLNVMDDALVGGARTTYTPTDTGVVPFQYGLMHGDGTESFWVEELVRPYPLWVGGRVSSIDYDFDARTLRLGLDLDGSGTTEIYAPPDRAYPDGFVATTTGGGLLIHDGDGVTKATGGMGWDADGSRVLLPPTDGAVEVQVRPT